MPEGRFFGLRSWQFVFVPAWRACAVDKPSGFFAAEVALAGFARLDVAGRLGNGIGRVLKITAPEGATADDALAFAQQQIGSLSAEPKSKEPSLIDTIKNAGLSVLDSLNPNSSVMDRIAPATGRGNAGVAISSGLGPMRQDFVDNTSSALRGNTVATNRAIAKQESQVAKIAGLVADRQERRASGDTLPRDRQDIIADVEEGALPFDTRSAVGRAYDATWELGNAVKTGALETAHGLRGAFNAYTVTVQPPHSDLRSRMR